MCVGLWKREPYESGIDERKCTRYEEWYLKSKLEQKSPQKWPNNHRHAKHHTKNAIILRPLFAIPGDVREDCLSNRDIASCDTIDDTTDKHPHNTGGKSCDDPPYSRAKHAPEEQISTTEFIRETAEIRSRNKTTYGICRTDQSCHQVCYMKSIDKCWQNREDNREADQIERYREKDSTFWGIEVSCIHRPDFIDKTKNTMYII